MTTSELYSYKDQATLKREEANAKAREKVAAKARAEAAAAKMRVKINASNKS